MAFNPLFRVLFTFRSHYFYAIGHPIYLALDVFYHLFVLMFQQTRLLNQFLQQSSSITRLLLSMACHYRTLIEEFRLGNGSIHNSEDSNWAIACSLAITDAILFSFFSCT